MKYKNEDKAVADKNGNEDVLCAIAGGCNICTRRGCTEEIFGTAGKSEKSIKAQEKYENSRDT